MKAYSSRIAIILILTVFCAVTASAQYEIPTAIASPLHNITIDGNLDDWPNDMVRYPIINHGQAYGPTDIDDADLTNSEDLTPVFMTGYSPKDNLLYLAVIVRDDIERIGYGFSRTDGCEVYVEGTKEGKITPRSREVLEDASKMAALQYVMCPNGGSYDMPRPGVEPANPRLNRFDITKTKTTCAYSRQGDVSVYEWAIEAFDELPDIPTKLVPGKMVGLDIVISDKDADIDSPAWVCWGPYKSLKALNADSLGGILIVDSTESLGTVSGTVIDPREKTVFPGFEFGIYRDDELFTTVRTDYNGHYVVILPEGKYSLIPKPFQGVLLKTVKNIEVKAKKETIAGFRPEPMKLPAIVEKSAGVYKNLTGYRDSMYVEVCATSDITGITETLPFSFTFERPNKLRFESDVESSFGNHSLYCNGSKMILYNKQKNSYMTTEAPETLDTTTIQVPVWQMTGTMIDLHFILSDNPLNTLLKNVESIQDAGSETLNGESVSVIDIIKPSNKMAPARTLPIQSVPYIPLSDSSQPIRMWIGKKDYLIKKLSFTLDMDTISENVPANLLPPVTPGKTIITVTHGKIELNPVVDTAKFAFKTPEGATEFRMFYSRAPSTKPREKKMDGIPAPDFTLPDVDGNEVSLSDFKGKVVVLNFWASWSEPCLELMPSIQSLSEKYNGKDIAIIGINTLEGEEPDYVKSFLKDHNISYRILLDSDDTVLEKFGLTKIPACYVIDRKGIVRFRHVGKSSGASVLEKNVVQLIAE